MGDAPLSNPPPRSEVAALLQLFQQQLQHVDQRREDRREAAEREERLLASIAEREARLEARLLQTTFTTSPNNAYHLRRISDRRGGQGVPPDGNGAAYILELVDPPAGHFPDLPIGTLTPERGAQE
jgi:hypothetical protein